jgi:hypothetical protein
MANSAADALSRYPFVQQEEFKELISAISTVQFNRQVLDAITSHYATDPFFSHVLANPDRYRFYVVEDGYIYQDGRLCILNHRPSKEMLLSLKHNDNNHFGYVKTLAALRETHFWQGMAKDVEQYVRTCSSCALNKSST